MLPPHLKMINHGVVAGDRASHLTSVQYAMAVAALAPDAAYELSPSREPPPAVRDFINRITVEADERLVTHVPGDPARPFDRARVREKFLRFAVTVLGTQKAEHMLARCSDASARGQFSSLANEIEAACSRVTPQTLSPRF